MTGSAVDSRVGACPCRRTGSTSPGHALVTFPGDQPMSIHRSRLSHRSAVLRSLASFVLLALSSSYAAAQQTSPSRVRGTVEAVDGDVLSVKSRAGEDVKLHMTADMLVLGIVKIPLSEIKVGSFVGATTVPGP